MRRLLGFAAFAAAALYAAQTGVIALGTLTATGTTRAVNLYMAAHKHTVEVAVAGSPASCSVQLEGTLDDPLSASAVWSNLSGAQSCTSSTMFHVIDRAVTAVRANVTALTGGTSPSVTVVYQGVQ